jgi:hypothetical protein
MIFKRQSHSLCDRVDSQDSGLNFLTYFVFYQLVLKMISEAISFKSSQEGDLHSILINLGDFSTDQESGLYLRGGQHRLCLVDYLLVDILICHALLNAFLSILTINELALDNL